MNEKKLSTKHLLIRQFLTDAGCVERVPSKSKTHHQFIAPWGVCFWVAHSTAQVKISTMNEKGKYLISTAKSLNKSFNGFIPVSFSL